MQKKTLLGGLLLCSAFLFTSCDKIMSQFDNAVDSHLVPADKLTVIGVGDTYTIAKDVDYATISDAAPKFESLDKTVATVDSKTGLVTALKSGDARIKISLPDNGLYLDASAIINVKVRVQNTTQFDANVKLLAAEDQLLLDENAAIELADTLKLTGKKVTIKGDENKPATFSGKTVFVISDNFTLMNAKIDASNVEKLFFLDGTTAVAKKADGTDSDHKLIEKVELSGVEISGLKDAFLTDNQKTLLENLTIENSIIEVPASNKVTFNFKPNNTAKGYIGKLAISKSTIWAAGNNTNFFVQYGSRPKNVNSDLLQVFDVQNSTFVNIANGKNFCDLVQNGTAQNVYTLKNNIFVNCGKNGQVVVGFNKGQQSKNPVWTIDGNNFCWGGSNVNAAETEKANKFSETDYVEIVKNCVSGVPAFKDAANGDFHQTNVKTGDSRWTK